MIDFKTLETLPEMCRATLIRMQCERIQAGWSEEVRERRRVRKPNYVVAHLTERGVLIRRVNHHVERAAG